MVNIISIILIIFLACYIIYRQVTTKKIKPKKRLIMIAILIFLSLESVSSIASIEHLSMHPLIYLVVIALIFGCISGLITKIFIGDAGELYQRGGWKMTIFLIIIIPLRVLLRHTLALHPGNEILKDLSIYYTVMLTGQITARNIIILLKIPMVRVVK